MRSHGAKYMSSNQRIFDFRLSHKRTVTEHAFAIIVNKFEVFTRNNLSETNVSTIVLASFMSYNLLREKPCDTYTPPVFANVTEKDNIRWEESLSATRN